MSQPSFTVSPGVSFGAPAWGTGVLPYGAWLHMFHIVYQGTTYVGLNGLWWTMRAGDPVTAVPVDAPVDHVALGNGQTFAYGGASTGVAFDEWRLTNGTRYLNLIAVAAGATSGSYTPPTGPLADDGAACSAAPSAVANGVVTSCTGALSGTTCVLECNSGYTAVGALVCEGGVWRSSAACAGKSSLFTYIHKQHFRPSFVCAPR